MTALPLSVDDALLISAAAQAWVNAAVADERAHEDLSHATHDNDFRLLKIAREATERRRQAHQDFLRLIHHGLPDPVNVEALEAVRVSNG